MTGAFCDALDQLEIFLFRICGVSLSHPGPGGNLMTVFLLHRHRAVLLLHRLIWDGSLNVGQEPLLSGILIGVRRLFT